MLKPGWYILFPGGTFEHPDLEETTLAVGPYDEEMGGRLATEHRVVRLGATAAAAGTGLIADGDKKFLVMSDETSRLIETNVMAWAEWCSGPHAFLEKHNK